MSKKVLLGLFLCFFIAFHMKASDETRRNSDQKKKVAAELAKKAEFADAIRIIGRANNAVKGFGLGGKKLKPAERANTLKKYIKQLSRKPSEMLRDTSARRELFNISVRDSILGLLLSIKREDSLAGMVKTAEFKKVSNIVGFSQ